MKKEVIELATSSSEIKQVKIDKELLKKSHVVYAKVKEDILTQEGIVHEALQFFIENFPKLNDNKKDKK